MYDEMFGGQGGFGAYGDALSYGDYGEPSDYEGYGEFGGYEDFDRWPEFIENNLMIDDEYVRMRLPQLPWNSHKGIQGKVLMIVGSEGMAGAAFLAGSGALKSGAGLVRLCAPKALFNILQTLLPEATCVDREALAELADSDMEAFNEKLMEYQAIVIGPGLGKAENEAFLIMSIIRNYLGPIVIDADGLNLISRMIWAPNGKDVIEDIKNAPGQLIFTPHRGEMIRLLNVELPEVPGMGRADLAEEYAQFAKMVSKKFNVITVMKHANTVVSGKESVSFNTTGNPGMATGGSGDVLSGTIAGLLAQGMFAPEAARCAVYMHGLAGDIAAEMLSMRGITAKDIAECLPFAFKRFE